jgi:hypothetical protein
VLGANGSVSEMPTVHDLARRGELARCAAAATGSDRRHITAAVYEVAWPLVFSRLTRRLELRRGHVACAVSFQNLAADCFDRFQDDLEAVVGDVLRQANKPIDNLEAWICSRLTAATVDAHRRRRGERGALQRPRLPGWLNDALAHDRWLTILAVEMLVWVGVATTAGGGPWPLDSWTHRRAVVTGDWRGSDTAVVEGEVELIRSVMRRRPQWYASYVEGPLGRKQAPVLPAQRGGSDRVLDPAPLPLVERYEVDDARLRALATVAVDAIEARIARGEAADSVVVSVLTEAFGGGTGRYDLDRVPERTLPDDERVLTLMTDPVVVDRVVATVLDIIAIDGR